MAALPYLKQQAGDQYVRMWMRRQRRPGRPLRQRKRSGGICFSRPRWRNPRSKDHPRPLDHRMSRMCRNLHPGHLSRSVPGLRRGSRGSADGTKRRQDSIRRQRLPATELVSVRKRLFCPNSSLRSKFNPRNIDHMPAVKFFARLDLEQNSSLPDGHKLVSVQRLPGMAGAGQPGF